MDQLAMDNVDERTGLSAVRYILLSLISLFIILGSGIDTNT